MQTSSSAPDLLRAAIGSEREAPPDPATLAPLFPELEILGLLGQGGMGAVYRVRRRADGAPFALKVVKPGPGQEDAFAARFAREAEALERLHHPNIVAIHGHGSAGPWCWLLMDLVDGANLREIVATGRLSPAQTLALVPPLCAALQYAHDQGVVHRDLKPENILLDAAGVPHLVDFGLAKLRDPKAGSGLTHTGAAMGTVHYMAPEQVASAKGVDHRADIYALGVVVYELLTGQLPLGRFESPSQRVQVDVRIDEVVLKALERDPERRWQQMRMVGEAITAVDTTPPTRSANGWTLPGWLRWTLLGLACGMLVASLSGITGPGRADYITFGAGLIIVAATVGRQERTPWKRWHWVVMGACALLGIVCVGLLSLTAPRPAGDPPPATRTTSAPAPVAAEVEVPTPSSAAIGSVLLEPEQIREGSTTSQPTAALPFTNVDGHQIVRLFAEQMSAERRIQADTKLLARRLRLILGEIHPLPEGLDCSAFRNALLQLPNKNFELVDAVATADARLSGRFSQTLDAGSTIYDVSLTVTRISDGTELWSGYQAVRKETSNSHVK